MPLLIHPQEIHLQLDASLNLRGRILSGPSGLHIGPAQPKADGTLDYGFINSSAVFLLGVSALQKLLPCLGCG